MINVEKIPLCDEYRERELSNLLEKLGKNVLPETQLENYADEITKLYDINGGYFHASYGAISGIITELYKKYERSYIDQISYNLGTIILFLKDGIDKVPDRKKGRYCQAYRSMVELRDFVSMEAIRVDQAERQIRTAMSKAETTLSEASKLNDEAKKSILEATQANEEAKGLDNAAKKTIKKAQELSDNAETIAIKAKKSLKKANKISNEAKNLKTDVISILAIFAAIILAVTGGLSIFGGAISSISVKEVSLFRLLLVIDFCVVGLFNTMYLLLYVVSRMAGKNLSDECKNGVCKECDQKNTCKGFNRFRKRAPYVVGFNIFLIIIGVVVTILHICGVFS